MVTSQQVHPESFPMTSSENSSKHMLEMGGSGSRTGATIFSTILSILALIISIATLCVLAIFFYQFQSLNIPDLLLTTGKPPYTALDWLTPEQIDDYEAFLFDVDGTLKNAQGYIPGSKEFIQQLVARNKTVVIVSNSDWSTPEDRSKSMNLGVPASRIVVPLVVLQAYETASLKGRRVLALAPPPVLQWLSGNGAVLLNTVWNHTRGETSSTSGIVATLNENPEVVIVDSWSDYDMEAIDRLANILANPEVKFYILSTDSSWRGEQNLIFSDGGSFYESLRTITGRNATGFGKPSDNLNRYLSSNFKLEKAIMFGDNLNTDIIMANGLGIDSCLMVGTGVNNELDWRRYYELGMTDRRPTFKGFFAQLSQLNQ